MRRADIVRLDKAHIWHPYTQMADYIDRVDPLVIARASGARLFDVDGRSYIDGNSSWWVATLGHNHPRLVDALKHQADILCHTSLAGVTHEGAALLSEELLRVAPMGLTRVFFSDNGSTAIEAALKMTVQYFQNSGLPQKARFVALDSAFHGETLGATSVSGVELFRRPFANLLLDCIHVEPPAHGDKDDRYDRAFSRLETTLRENADEIAGVVLEPVLQGASGMRMYDPKYVTFAQELCEALNILFIVDEVFTGYGRTGKMWALEHGNNRADIVCLAKGFSGGMLPMSATLTTERVFSAFLGPKQNSFHYGHSYCGNPLGARVAREVLAVYRDERILEKVQPKAARVAKAFADLEGAKGVSRTRALGMVGALDLEGTSGYLGELGWRVYDEARQRGAYLRPLGNTVYVAPPLNIPDEDLEELLAIVRESVLSLG